MKTTITTLFLCPFLLFSQARTSKELLAVGYKKYEAQNGRITYTITGDATGEEVMVFDAFGWNSMRKQTMIFELYGIKTIQTLHEIIDGDYVYRLNDGDSTFVARKDFKWSQQAAYKNPDQSSEAILFSLGGEHAADSVHLDKKCQVWTFEGKALQQLWVWNGLVLKRKTKLGDRIIFSTANSIETGTAPDPSSFTIPDYLQEKK